MHPVVGRLAALSLATLATCSPVRAQPTDDLPSVDSGELASPTNHVGNTMVVIFDRDLARDLGGHLVRLREAAAACNRPVWYREYRPWWTAMDRKRREADASGDAPDRDPIFRGKANEDYRALRDFTASADFPILIANCGPEEVGRPPLDGEVLPGLGSQGAGIPEQKIADLPIAVFDEPFARLAGQAVAVMRQAAKNCNIQAYVQGSAVLREAMQRRADQTGRAKGRDLLSRGLANYDFTLVETYMRENWIRFPQPCTPQRDRR